MTPELDPAGPAAPPRANGELVFEHPWQGRLFATTMALCDAAVVDYADLRDRLISEIARRDASGGDSAAGPAEYWAAWQDALEALLIGRQLCDAAELGTRAARFGRHA